MKESQNIVEGKGNIESAAFNRATQTYVGGKV